jgi:hypothetical protein
MENMIFDLNVDIEKLALSNEYEHEAYTTYVQFHKIS